MGDHIADLEAASGVILYEFHRRVGDVRSRRQKRTGLSLYDLHRVVFDDARLFRAAFAPWREAKGRRASGDARSSPCGSARA